MVATVHKTNRIVAPRASRGALLALAALLLGGFAAPALPSPAFAEDDTRPSFYFYSPDWRPGDLNVFTEELENALTADGIRVRFQAFARFSDFIQQLKSAPPEFLIAPSWIASDGVAGSMRELIAQPIRAGRTVYRKALMTTDDIDVVQDLANGSIAATVHTLGRDGESVVLEVFNLDPTTAQVVAVPKDADALLALSFGQVDGALVTSEQFEQQSTANPKVTRDLRVLAFTPDIDLPGVYASDTATREHRRAMADALDRLSGYQAGRNVLEMFGYDEFVLTRASLRERRVVDRLRRR